MLETAAALVFGHVVADFTLQSDGMVRDKTRPRVLLLHVAVVTGASWLALGLAPQPLLLGLIAISHYVIDWVKLRHGGKSLAPFLVDQAGHLAMIALGASIFPTAFSSGLWGLAPGWVPHLPQGMALAAGVIATIWAGDHAVRALMQPLTPHDPTSLPKGGRLIGRLERTMILMLVLSAQTAAIGFLIAAKSLLRFNELARDADRSASEYVIIGTLASFAWGLAAAFATQAALRALAP